MKKKHLFYVKHEKNERRKYIILKEIIISNR